jgi:Do/DeqQ family serine protease
LSNAIFVHNAIHLKPNPKQWKADRRVLISLLGSGRNRLFKINKRKPLFSNHPMQDSNRFSRYLRQITSLFWVGAIALVLAIAAPLMPVRAAIVPGSQAIALAPQAVDATGTGSFVTQAVDRVGPAVVRIDTERTVTMRGFDPFAEDPFFQRFFGDSFVAPVPQERRLRGQGSGFIIDKKGIVVTNAHVVDRADRVTVTLKDGRQLEGQVLGTDEVTDLAVVQIDSNRGDLPVAPLGDSTRVKVGDWAIAVGNPLGLDNTVTLGIVSTLKRSSSEAGIPDKRLDFIQTDAAINPGNSGGPLLNARGEVIGINTAIRADANGIGFAIPIDQFKAIQAQLISGEAIAHPYLGIQMITLTPEIAREHNRDPNASFQLPEMDGVLILNVLPNTPAAAAGLRAGDIVTALDGDPVRTAGQLQHLVEQSQVGQNVELTIRRGDRTRAISVRTAQLQA